MATDLNHTVVPAHDMAGTPTPPSTARLTLILGALNAFGPL